MKIPELKIERFERKCAVCGSGLAARLTESSKKFNDKVLYVYPCQKCLSDITPATKLYLAYINLCRTESMLSLGFDAFRDTQMSVGIIQDAIDGGMTESEVWDCLKNHKIPIGKQEK